MKNQNQQTEHRRKPETNNRLLRRKCNQQTRTICQSYINPCNFNANKHFLYICKQKKQNRKPDVWERIYCACVQAHFSNEAQLANFDTKAGRPWHSSERHQ